MPLLPKPGEHLRKVAVRPLRNRWNKADAEPGEIRTQTSQHIRENFNFCEPVQLETIGRIPGL